MTTKLVSGEWLAYWILSLMLSPVALAGSNPNKNPWWPLMPGNSWTLQKSDNGHKLTISVQPVVPQFGCGTDVTHLLLEKEDVDSYWGPGLSYNLDWFLGVDPNGDVRGYGHSLRDLSGNVTGGTMNYRSENSSIPAYFIVPGNVTDGQRVSNRHSLPTSNEITNDCLPADNNFYSTWNVVWTMTTVNTPAYKGPALKASYDEASGGRQIEDWYFAPGIGIARIVTRSQDGTIGVDMQLSSYRLNKAPTSVTAQSAPSPQLQFSISKNGTVASPSAVIEASVGDNISYLWSATGATSLASYYVADGSDTCPGGFASGLTQQPWAANSLQGSTSGTLQPCQAGHTYVITLQAISAAGFVTPASVTIHVSSQPPEPKPSIFLSLTLFGHNTYGVYNVGDTINFLWTTQDVARVESYYYATATDKCAESFGPNDTTKPWVVQNSGLGNLSVKALPCEAARAYTVSIVGYSASGRQVARDQVIFFVNGSVEQRMDASANTLPQTWDVWAYYFQADAGQSVGDLTSYVPDVDPDKRFNLIPLDVWWRCTQSADCDDMSDLLSEASPTGD